jgi:hypothetical protein
MSQPNPTSRNLVCSFCGKTADQVAKLIAGPTVFICDECVDLCNDIIAEETEVPAAESELAPPWAGQATPQVVTRYVDEALQTGSPDDPGTVYWVCEGCGWRLGLKPGAMPPTKHSEEIQLGTWPGPLRKLPPRELVPECANPKWQRIS